MVQSIVIAYTDAITKGIEGGLSNVEKEDLKRKGRDLGLDISDQDFVETAEGF
jgi:hypothetical protein